ncbi:hypothetical protein LLG95_09160 [bacterium]|nr:hypothetical protein [bacterium]
MPVYELHYQTYEGPRRGAVSRWFAIARYSWMGLLGRRAIVWLFTISWLQFLLRAALLYIMVNKNVQTLLAGFGIRGLANIIPVDAFFFKTMIDWQLPFCFLFVFILGAGLISQDLAHNALVLFAAKPISRWEYFLGKFATVFLLIMMLTWLQTIVLYMMQWAMAPEGSPWATSFWSEYAWLIVPITIYPALLAASLSLLILTFSSLTRNGRYAGVAFAATLIGLASVASILKEAVGSLGFIQSSDWLVLSPVILAHELGDHLFKLKSGLGISPKLAWITLAAFWVLCGAILKIRLQQSMSKGA